MCVEMQVVSQVVRLLSVSECILRIAWEGLWSELYPYMTHAGYIWACSDIDEVTSHMNNYH